MLRDSASWLGGFFRRVGTGPDCTAIATAITPDLNLVLTLAVGHGGRARRMQHHDVATIDTLFQRTRTVSVSEALGQSASS